MPELTKMGLANHEAKTNGVYLYCNVIKEYKFISGTTLLAWLTDHGHEWLHAIDRSPPGKAFGNRHIDDKD